MPIRKLKPRSPGVRAQTISGFDEVTKSTPEKSLLVSIARKGGRNSNGRITAKRRGGGHRKQYRVIDFKRRKDGIPGKVVGIEYDPNRSARIALLSYSDGEKRYIIAPAKLNVGDVLMSGEKAEVRIGNCLLLKDIPEGTLVHNVEMRPGKGAQIARSAGSGVQLMAKEGDYVTLKLKSGEVRLIHRNCRATIGTVGNADHENVSIGKAGRVRWMGIRPRVRAVAMNPVDHPMGGGEGRSSGGRHPCSPWGQSAKGLKTRKVKKISNKFILSRKKKK
ncbi:MAG: 50S ribosomal protein L2 [Nitrospina sp.]|jgi:large subunit ribosomal protein L2|nr:50S ribosomal protein L2 [Nitrospina sp.]MBT3415442.1 50S ribosomal protein L2 [Nitrospina sp.]MBT4106008.1 50S ribosomal protein L2 [Nitrospina sp.]MBT4388284.1 50S ribosomal protein L2 [Nitrospina sp.]MBT4619629.1 50S ribosomal protein L2 [Nitrospina sp.]